MKDYELYISVNYTTDGGAEEGSYFIEYVMAEDRPEATRRKKTELECVGYYNITIDIIEV